jgi:hypothetical protein
VAVKRGRNSTVEELNVTDARRYGDHNTGDMVRLRDDVELPEQAEDPSTYATAPAYSSASYTKSSSSKRVGDTLLEEEGSFNTWSAPMGLSAPATTPSYAYDTGNKTVLTTTTRSYGDGYANSTYGYNKGYNAGTEDPAERMLRMKTAPKPSSSSSSYGEESNRGRRSKSFDDDDSDSDFDADGEKSLERRGSRNRHGNLVPVLPPQPADVHLRHYDPQQEFGRRFDNWERKDVSERERQRRELEKKDEEYARELQRKFDREQRSNRSRTASTSASRKPTSADPEKTLDSLWKSEPFY